VESASSLRKFLIFQSKNLIPEMVSATRPRLVNLINLPNEYLRASLNITL
jgi:hypothetical protein